MKSCRFFCRSLLLRGALFVALPVLAQNSIPPAGPDPSVIPTIRTGTSLTLVDVIAEQPADKLHTRRLVTELKQTDFRLFDNDREVPIHTFDVGAEHTTKPIALWLVVQCNMGFPIGWGSGYMRGKTHWLAPALAALQPADVVGVAHWCDNGETKVDLTPSTDGGLALSTVEAVLKSPTAIGESRKGELALQRLFSEVLAATDAMTPQRLPVFVFLYGDHSATYAKEAENIIQSLLESSGIVFGLTEPGSEANLAENLGGAGQVSHLIHHYAAETGGQYLSASQAELLPSALAYMITEVHLRYVLGFRPAKLDGKRHSLRVELTKASQKVHSDLEIRARDEYIPISRIR